MIRNEGVKQCKGSVDAGWCITRNEKMLWNNTKDSSESAENAGNL